MRVSDCSWAEIYIETPTRILSGWHGVREVVDEETGVFKGKPIPFVYIPWITRRPPHPLCVDVTRKFNFLPSATTTTYT